MERLLANSLFKNSKRYPSLLRYVVEHALEGDTSQLKERTLGVEVFGRDPHYDTNLDPVVRTTAGEIRKRIAQYYHEPGRASEIRIDLPSGSYLPEFRHPVEHVVPIAVASAHPRWGVYAAAVVALVVLALVAWAKPWAQPTELDRFWGPVFSASSPAMLCVAPAIRNRVNDTPQTGQKDGLEADASISDVQKAESQHIALSDATTMSRIAGLLQLKNKSYHIRNEFNTSFQDLREGPVVLVGAFNNAWTIRLTDQMRYSFDRDPVTHNCWIKDKQKPSNRDWSLNMSSPYLKVARDYAIISRFTDPTTEQVVVVGAGISIHGTMAAGEFLSNPAYMQELSKVAPSNWDRRNIEVVIATNVINGNSGPPRIVATYFW